jgi:hypothetical protein
MCPLARPQPAALVIELSRRLAEDYPAVPLAEVAKVVKRAAADSLTLDDTVTAEELEAALAAAEQRARQALGRRPAGDPST